MIGINLASLNKVQIIGSLGRDPEIRYTASGDALTSVTIATTGNWKDKATGEKMEATEWHRITFFGKLAEIASQYLMKGSQVYVDGSQRTRKYKEKDGVEKYSTEIKADEMKMLGSRKGGVDSNDGSNFHLTPPRQHWGCGMSGPVQNNPRAPSRTGFTELPDDTIPFINNVIFITKIEF